MSVGGLDQQRSFSWTAVAIAEVPTTVEEHLDRSVLDYVQEHAAGPYRAKTFNTIARALHVTGHGQAPWRKVAGAIESLRGQGFPVGTARTGPCRGAWWPTTPGEVALAVDSATKGLWTRLRTYHALRRSVGEAIWRQVEDGQLLLLLRRVSGQEIERVPPVVRQAWGQLWALLEDGGG